MVKRVKVGVSSDKIQTTRTTAWGGRERKTEDKSQRVLNLLAGSIIGQGIMLVAAVVVLTIFLHSNVRYLWQIYCCFSFVDVCIIFKSLEE